jgi:hypothetical protein
MIEFFRQHQSHRIRAYDALPVLLDDGLTLSDEEQVDWDVEMPRDDWQPRDVALALAPPNWPLQPCRFIDGKDVGDTVAWLQSEEGYPVPVRLSQIGAIAMRVVNGELRREDDVPMERVVSMIVDLFPWDEIEDLARDLRTSGFRLLPSELPLDKSQMFDFERMRKTTQNRSNDEMIRLERQTLAKVTDVVTVVDGRLEPRAGAFDAATSPVIGVIKTHSRNYLHAQGWRVFYNLKPGQRTPAVLLEGGKLKLPVITWYLRLEGERGELPNWGIVRLEIAKQFFDGPLAGEWVALDRLSRIIREFRCRDSRYGRAPVSLQPIQRAEESLGSLFTDSGTLAQHFYRLADL